MFFLGNIFYPPLLSLEDFEGRMNAAIERNAFLESELDEKVHKNDQSCVFSQLNIVIAGEPKNGGTEAEGWDERPEVGIESAQPSSGK